MQLFSFLIELIGFSITRIEIKYPELADAIEDWIDETGEKLFRYGAQNHTALWYQIVFAIWAGMSLFAVTAFFGNEFPMLFWVFYWPFTAAASVGLIIAALAEIIDLLNGFHPGHRAITSLGYYMGFTGLALEAGQLAYQFFT